MDETGKSHEKIFDVAWSGERRIDASGNLPAVGNTVDATTASYRQQYRRRTVVRRVDRPGIRPVQEAFYYARVIEIPTPRWTTFDAVQLGIPAPEPVSLQERAVTSAIWYSPRENTPR